MTLANYFMSGKEKAAFIVAGLVETFLFLASILGFIGTCARKQSFVVTYAIFLYVHFFINLGVAIYFLVMVTSAANTDIVKLCQDGLKDPGSKSQCSGLLNITKDVYWAISLVILSIEAYCALIVTRYVNQLRYEKRDVRRSRMIQRQSAYDAFHRRFASATSEGGVESNKEGEGLLHQEFNPYDISEREQSRSPAVTPTIKAVRDFAQVAEVHGTGLDTKGEDIEMGRVSESETRAAPESSKSLLDTPYEHERPISEDYSQPPLRARSPPPSYL